MERKWSSVCAVLLFVPAAGFGSVQSQTSYYLERSPAECAQPVASLVAEQRATDLPVPLRLTAGGQPGSADPRGLRRATEVIDGHRARLHFAELKARYEDRFVDAGQAHESRGFWPTQQVVVFRTISYASTAGTGEDGSSAVVPVTTVSTGDGEVVMHSWDDGNPGTWEGTMYVQDYQTGNWAGYDVQYDITTEEVEPIYAESYGSGGPGRDPFPVRLTHPRSTGVKLAALSVGEKALIPIQCGMCNYYMIYHTDFGRCFSSGAAGCVVACRLAGAGWPECAGACAGGILVTCALQNLMK